MTKRLAMCAMAMESPDLHRSRILIGMTSSGEVFNGSAWMCPLTSNTFKRSNSDRTEWSGSGGG